MEIEAESSHFKYVLTKIVLHEAFMKMGEFKEVLLHDIGRGKVSNY